MRWDWDGMCEAHVDAEDADGDEARAERAYSEEQVGVDKLR